MDGGRQVDPYETYETYEAFDAVLAAGAPLAGLSDALSEGDPLAWRKSAETPRSIRATQPELARSSPRGPTPGASHGRRRARDNARNHQPDRVESVERHVERERQKNMDRWQDNVTGAMATDPADAMANGQIATDATTPASATAADVTDLGGTGVKAAPAAPLAGEYASDLEQTPGMSPAVRVALIVGAASLTALLVAGGVTALVIQGRRALNARAAAREMERALAASRLLRITPAVARPHLLEASQAGSSASQHALQSAAETARMARALGTAAGVSASTARDYAADRASNAQDAITTAYSAARDALTSAYSAARDNATGGWKAVSQPSPLQPQWMIRAFNAGRFAGRMEQRLK